MLSTLLSWQKETCWSFILDSETKLFKTSLITYKMASLCTDGADGLHLNDVIYMVASLDNNTYFSVFVS